MDASNVRVGDKLVPDPMWNKTSGPYATLPEHVEVLDIDHPSSSQSGYLFKVQYIKGEYVWLDSDWFTQKVK